jgi:hypothetical protein
MDITTTLTSFDISQLSFVQSSSNGRFGNVLYGGKPLLITTPIMVISRDVVKQYGKYYLDLSFQNHFEDDPTSSALFMTLYEIDREIINHMHRHSIRLFGKYMTTDNCRSYYIRALRNNPIPYQPPRIRIRIPQDTYRAYDSQLFTKGTFIRATIKCSTIWWSPERKQVGCMWSLYRINSVA